MKEIGGYLQLDKFIDNAYYKDLIELNTARNALIYLVKAKNIEKIYIPYYLCDSVYNVLNKYSINYEYYKIEKGFKPIFEKKLQSNEYLYVVNYYGQLSNDKLLALKEKYKNIIVDNVQAFFQKPTEGIDTIYSCRKFFGVPDGAYLYTDVVLDEELKFEESARRMEHLLGRYEGTASDYYKEFKNNDASFMDEPVKFMSKLSRNILGAINYERVIKTRNSNYRYLNDELGKSNILDIISPVGAFAYPYYVEKGIEIRRELAKKKIYVATLWPNVLNEVAVDSVEYDYTVNILPLPCDQRYNKSDMEIIIKELLS